MPRVLALTTVLLATALAPATAAAESLTAAPGSDPAAGRADGVHITYDAGPFPLNLTVVARPASGPACQPTSIQDAAQAGGAGTVYVTSQPLSLAGAGQETLALTYPDAGFWRVCAWMFRDPGDVAAAASYDVQVRPPRATLAITATQVEPRAGGSDISLRMTGESEVGRDPLALVIPADDGGCPPVYDEQVADTVFDRPENRQGDRLTGAYDETLQTRQILSYRRWRICAYLQDGSSAEKAVAAATTVIDLQLAPTALRPPKVRISKGRATCDGGRWRARPTARTTIAWLADGRKVGSGRSVRLKPGWRRIACRVTARNKLGSKTSTSRAVAA